MKKLIFIILYFCVINNAWTQRPPQGPLSWNQFIPEEQGYELFWEDTFNGNSLDESKWSVRGTGARNLGYISPEAVSVKDGYLHLSAFRKGDSTLISAVGSQNKFMTRYGYFECRAQLQKSPGIWAAFWLQSPKLSEGDDPALYGAEIDIFEFFKKLGEDILSHNVWWGPYGPGQKTTKGMQSYLKGISEGFHLFALEWTPEKYVFYIDGLPFYEVRQGVSQIDQYIILSMEIPNSEEDLKYTRYPDVFLVDYVKVYKKK